MTEYYYCDRCDQTSRYPCQEYWIKGVNPDLLCGHCIRELEDEE